MLDFDRDGYYVIHPGQEPVFTPATEEVPYAVIRETVGGYVEHFQLSSGGAKHKPDSGPFGYHIEYDGTLANMFLNEEGKLNGLPVNALASRMAWRCALPPQDYIVGTVIILCGAAREKPDTDEED